MLLAQGNPYSDDARQSYGFIKGNLLEAADKMPAEDYSFRTTPKVRTFGEMIAHVADAQMLMCAVVKGEEDDCRCSLRTRQDRESGSRGLAQGVV